MNNTDGNIICSAEIIVKINKCSAYSFPTLYRINGNRIRKWYIAIEDRNNSTYEVITVYGNVVKIGDSNLIANGKMRVNTKIIDYVKSNRSKQEQAIFESTSKWNKKIKKDYTSTPWVI